MGTYLNIAEILVSVLLVVVVLMQVRGVSGGIFGTAEGSFRARRGFERTLFRFTIVLAVLFVLISLLSVRFAGF